MAITKQLTFEGHTYNLGKEERLIAKAATAADTTLVQASVPNFSNAIEVSEDTTLAFATHCGRPVIQTAASVFTLPAISGGAVGQTFWIINGADDGTLMTISPNSNDKFLWDVAGAAGDDDNDIINTAATAKKGDYVKLSYGSADGWTIDEMGGTWADES